MHVNMLLASLSSPTTVLELYVQMYNTCAKQKGKLFLSGLIAPQNGRSAVSVFGSSHGRRHEEQCGSGFVMTSILPVRISMY